MVHVNLTAFACARLEGLGSHSGNLGRFRATKMALATDLVRMCVLMHADRRNQHKSSLETDTSISVRRLLANP